MRTVPTSRLRRFGLVILNAVFLSAARVALAQTGAGPGSPDYTGPNLEIPIPGVEFSGIIRDNDITIPWLAQYIGGVYTFLISIVGLLAATVIVFGGFQYVTSAGDKGKIGAAKKRIMNAMIGLVLVFGSYTVLYAINPALTSFDGLKLRNVDVEVLQYEHYLGTTTADTGSMADTGGGAEAGVAGSYTPQYSACPLKLPIGKYNAVIAANICASTEKNSKPTRCTDDSDCPAGDTCAGKVAFYKQIRESGVITATTPRAKVLQIADVADACNVNLGSCGETAGTINALAGVGKTSCLQRFRGCNDEAHGRLLFGVSGEEVRYFFGWNCAIDQKEYPNSLRPDCKNSPKEAVAQVRTFLFSEAASGKLPKDWPDSWANRLRPGDRIVIYNGNKDLTGGHAAIFVGWASDGMSAQVIQGGGGGSGAETSRARGGAICIKKACGDKMIPLTRAWSPD